MKAYITHTPEGVRLTIESCEVCVDPPVNRVNQLEIEAPDSGNVVRFRSQSNDDGALTVTEAEFPKAVLPAIAAFVNRLIR